MSLEGKIWYAIYTKARNEKKVSMLFSQAGIEHFLPLIKREKIWSDRKKVVEEPLFASYIFVHLMENEQLKVMHIPGVVRFISFEGMKVPVRDQTIEAIRFFVETGEDFFLKEEDYMPGKKVRVVTGSLKGLEGRLIQHLGKQRVKIEVDAIRHSIFLRLPMAALEIIK